MVTKQNKKILRTIGRMIRDERLLKNYSQKELAERSGLSRYYLGLIEHGRKNISIAAFRDIAKALQLPAWQLLKEAENEAERK